MTNLDLDPNYSGSLDVKFFNGQDVKVVKYQPWQFGLFHPDLKGKMVWYPRKGTLMFEDDNTTYKVGEYLDSEEVYQQIINKINQ